MRRFFKSKWFKTLVIIFVIVIIGTVIGVGSKGKTSPFSNACGVIAQPFQRAASWVGNGFKGIGTKFRTLKSYEKQVDELQKEVDKYQKQLVDYENLKQQNKTYKEFLQIRDEHKDFKVQPATVIGRDAANAYSYIVLNKGKNAGIEKNDPVICGNGQVVGQVKKVGATYSVVSTIYDSNVKVGAYEVRTRETSYTTNSAKDSRKQRIKLVHLSKETTIAPGGIVSTSGVGSIYPRDLILGTVEKVEDDNRDISCYAVVKPNFDITRLENVLIITDFNGQGTSITED